MRKTKKFLAGLLAASMVIGLTACGSKTENETGATNTPVPTKAEQPGNSGTTDPKPENNTPAPTEPQGYVEDHTRMAITVSLPSDEEHVEANQWYDKLRQDLSDYLQMDITWEWTASATYYDDEHLGLRIATADVADVCVVGKNSAFLEAAEEGLFWDLAPYIDDYDNLRTIPQATRENASYNGKMYGIPRSRTLARNGLGYRVDWLNNLGLAEPTDWDSFYNMLYAFTYKDPDGNGVDDTVGLGLDSWDGVFNIMMTWFGVPNEWGIKDGNLIYKYETEEYKTALKAFRQLFSEGLINQGLNGIPDFRDVKAGKARDQIVRTGMAGCGVQVLDDQRKVETYFEDQGLATEDEPIYTLQGYVDTGKGPLCYPTTGMNNMIAISTKNIKTEEQLRRVLLFLNELNDGACMNLIEYGWENLTYKLDENGYVTLFTSEELATSGVESTKYNYGFNQVIPYFTAPENDRPVTVAPPTSAIRLLENQLYADDIQYCVPNYGASYVSETFIKDNTGDTINKQMQEAQLKYIVGEIDEAGLAEAIKTWKAAGGDQITKEMNDLFHK